MAEPAETVSVSRRRFLQNAAALVGCGTAPTPPKQPAPQEAKQPESVNKFNFGEGIPENLREDVPEELRIEIENGVEMGIRWLAIKTGIDLAGTSVFAYSNADWVIDEYFKRTIYPGNFDERRAALRQATAFGGERQDVYIFTGSRGWTGASPIIGGPIVEGRYHTIFHELFHLLQGRVNGYRQRPLGWQNEGGGHYTAARALDENTIDGRIIFPYDEIRRRHLSRAPFARNTLQQLEEQDLFRNADNYSLSFLALDLLTRGMPDNGIPALVRYWTEIGNGTGIDNAFTIAFSESRTQFYTRFEAYRARGFQQ